MYKVCLKNDKEGCRTRAIKASKASHKKQKENVEDWKTCRERALEHYALTCMRCGNNFPRKKLVVHHRDGKNICSELADHSLKNLMVLCRKCHNQLHKELRSVIGKFVGLSNVEKGMHYMLRGLKEEYGLKIEDQHFKDTPKRVARSFAEIFEGVKDTEKQIEKILSTAFTSDMDQMIVIKDMHVFSMCPHHFLPVEMYVDVAYIPSGFVLGLSKIPRLVEVLAKRPVIQEQVTEEITKYLMDIKALGAAARIRGQHFCMRMRGVKKPESIAITTSVTGAFKDDLSTRQEFLTYLQDSKTF